MKIAIYNGDWQLPTFVESLASELSKTHEVFVLGKLSGVRKAHNLRYSLVASGISSLNLSAFFMLFKIAIRDLFLHPKVLIKLFMGLFKEGKKETVNNYVLESQLNAIQPDIVHIQWASHLAKFEHLLLNRNFKLVVSLRGRLVNVSPFVQEDIRRLYERIFPKADAFHAVSDAIAENAMLFGATKDKIKIIRPAVDQSLLAQKKLIDGEEGKLKIISAGRLHWKKGYLFALDALKRLENEKLSFHYTLIAPGDDEELLYHLDDLGLKESVTLIKGLPHKEVLQSIAEADLFLLPSVEEGIANVVLEAMALGTPVISTNCGGMNEVIEDYVNGILVPLRDANALAKGILDFSQFDEEKKLEMAAKAKEKIKENHLITQQINSFQELYLKLIH